MRSHLIPVTFTTPRPSSGISQIRSIDTVWPLVALLVSDRPYGSQTELVVLTTRAAFFPRRPGQPRDQVRNVRLRGRDTGGGIERREES